jgi:hypothetical protein
VVVPAFAWLLEREDERDLVLTTTTPCATAVR